MVPRRIVDAESDQNVCGLSCGDIVVKACECKVGTSSRNTAVDKTYSVTGKMLSIGFYNNGQILVAGTGFEPVTFGL